MTETKELLALVRGRVTGVMFRDFVRRKARKLGLRGTVVNRPDSIVQVVVQGDADSLRQLVTYLERGSLWSRVDGVEIIWRKPGPKFPDFRIIY